MRDIPYLIQSWIDFIQHEWHYRRHVDYPLRRFVLTVWNELAWTARGFFTVKNVRVRRGKISTAIKRILST